MTLKSCLIANGRRVFTTEDHQLHFSQLGIWGLIPSVWVCDEARSVRKATQWFGDVFTPCFVMGNCWNKRRWKKKNMQCMYPWKSWNDRCTKWKIRSQKMLAKLKLIVKLIVTPEWLSFHYALLGPSGKAKRFRDRLFDGCRKAEPSHHMLLKCRSGICLTNQTFSSPN